MSRNLILPGNPRYQPLGLQEYFGYDNLYRTVIEVEFAGLRVLGDVELIPKQDIALLTPEVAEKVFQLTTTEVDELERRATKHDIRALVRLIQERLPEPLRRWAHIPFTSYDVLETGRILQYRRSYDNVLLPKTRDAVRIFADLVHRHAKVLQIGRTHGQHALPITVGFWLATILSRAVYNSRQMRQFADGLVAKISGAVGASNAVHELGIAKLCAKHRDNSGIDGASFEARVLYELELWPADISTQILPPEPLAYFLFSCAMLSATFGQFGCDCRNLMRTEIAEVGQPRDKSNVGSSTMAGKINPQIFENLQGQWLRTKNELGKVLDTLISEHQRDLVSSSLYRDFPIILVNLDCQLNALLSTNSAGETFLSRVSINEQNCLRNIGISANTSLGEPMYIALQMAGYKEDAHKLLNEKAVPLSREKNQPLIESVQQLAQEDEELATALAAIPKEVLFMLHHPECYVGNAAEKARLIADETANYLAEI